MKVVLEGGQRATQLPPGQHRSIADEQELLLMPAWQSEKPVVPVTAIYGANASGKSTVISALAFMQEAVLHSFSGGSPMTGSRGNPSG